jgi:tetratricopeptide (TPR) repeat protein/predicted Ser/Thr protein kinase
VLDDSPPTSESPVDRRIGTLVGRYKVSAVLGRGGAGTVYLAERADEQYSARVAIKVLAQGAHSLGMRFKLERQILASLNHPNIARLIDAGETDDGQPYLVMEYVEGAPVHRYCDEQQLSVQQRLQLFMEICSAVQYAHQNLVVHRDLKPQNVLVDATGTVKLLDFGIAKLLENGSTTVALTRMHERVLTVEYASPEQIRGDAITTSSDVYSLGVMLYELLTGVLPFPVTPNASQVELERLVCLTDPPRPSAAVLKALETNPENMLAIAAARDLTPERLARRLLGDIDAIVLRALRKEAEHRYSSVEQFSADLRRHLQNEPVQARQGNWVYYSQRFMRRHTATVAVGTTFVLGLIGVSIAMSVQAHRLSIALERAEVVSEFMTNVFAASDPFVHRGKELTAGELLEAAAQKITADLQKEPEVRSRLLEAIGRSFVRQALPARAIPYLEEAARIQRSLGSTDARTASVLTELAISYREAGRFEDANRAFEEGLAISNTLREENSRYRARLLVDLGRLEMWRSNPQKAETQIQAGLAITRAVDGPRSLEAASILLDLSSLRLWLDDPKGAEQIAHEAIAIYREVAPPLQPDRVTAGLSLGEALLYQGRYDEAAELFEAALEARRKLYAPTSSRIADVLITLAQARNEQRRGREAEALLREAIQIGLQGTVTQQHKIVYPQTTLGRTLLERGAVAEAEKELRAALELSIKTLGVNHQYTASCGHYLGEALLQLDRAQDAADTLRTAIERWRHAAAPAWRIARSQNALGEALHGLGEIEAAKRLLAESYRVLKADAQADKTALERARQRLERFYPDYITSN